MFFTVSVKFCSLGEPTPLCQNLFYGDRPPNQNSRFLIKGDRPPNQNGRFLIKGDRPSNQNVKLITAGFKL
ncbi:MAG: hypothetical protein LBQ77_04965 [Treponema sp.]|nr:hypothetical protein [Treponema sp.]